MKSTSQSRLVDASTGTALGGRSRRASDIPSTSSHRVSRGQNVVRRIFIAVMVCATLVAIPLADTQGQLVQDKAARVAPLAGREEPVNNLEFLAISLRLVIDHGAELVQAEVANGARQRSIDQHSTHIQIFDGDDIESLYQVRSELVEVVFAAVGDAGVKSGHLYALAIPPTAAFLSSRENPLRSRQLLGILRRMPRVGNSLSIRERRQPIYPQVNADRLAGLGQGVDFLVEAQRHEISPGTVLGYRDCAGLTRERARPVDVHSSYSC